MSDESPAAPDDPEDDSRGGTRADGGAGATDRGWAWALRVRGTVARRDIGSLSREKTIVLALIIQLFVAAFSSFLVVGLTSLYDPASVQGEVTVGVSGNASDDLVAAASGLDGFDAVSFDSDREARGAFETGTVDALVTARHRQREDGSRIAVVATVPANSFRQTLVVVQLRAALEALERRERRDRVAFLSEPPVRLPPQAPASPYFGFSYTILVPLLLFLPVFIAGSVAVDIVTEEIERGTLELLRVAPLSLTAIVDGKALGAAVLGPAQALLWMVLLSFNGIAVANLGLLLALTTGLGLALVAAGLGLAVAVRERQRAQLLYSMGVLAVFAGAVVLPEHPATTAALLAIDSPGPLTVPLALGYLAFGLGVFAAIRVLVSRVDTEGL